MGVFQFTIVSSVNPHYLTKVYRLDAKGNAFKDKSQGGGYVLSGHADIHSVHNPDEFADVLQGLQHNQALVYGISKDNPHSELYSHKKYADLGSPSDAITRTRECFSWCDGGGILMLDYDPNEGTQALSKDELIHVLQGVLPPLERSAYVWWCSSSSMLFKANGEQISGIKGQRVYIFVNNANDIERVGKNLANRLWLAGHGYIVVGRAGQCLERTLIDTSVWQPEKLDFASGAKCFDGIEQRRPKPYVHHGEILDTATIHDLTPQELETLAQLTHKAKQDVKPTSESNRKAHIEQRAKKIVGKDNPTAKELEHAKASIKAALDHDTLTGEFIITLHDGTQCTIEQILTHPEKYHQVKTKDPLEPEYDGGRTVGILYTDKIPATLYSQAHGGKRYILNPQRQQHIAAELDYLTFEPCITRYDVTERFDVFKDKLSQDLPYFEKAEDYLKAVKALKNNDDISPLERAKIALAYVKHILPNVPYKYALNGLKRTLEQHANIHHDTLHSIMKFATWACNKQRTLHLQQITISTRMHGLHHYQTVFNLDNMPTEYHGVTIVAAPSGYGKTQKAAKQFINFAKSQNGRVIAIAHLKSLIKEMSQRLELLSYADAKNKNLEAHTIQQLACCLPSINNDQFSSIVEHCDYLFIDEIATVLKTFTPKNKIFSGDRDAKIIFELVVKMVRDAESVMVCDANINDEVIYFLSYCRPNEKFNIYEIKPTTQDKHVTVYSDSDRLELKILADLKMGKKIWVTADSEKKAKELATLYEMQDFNVMLVTSKTNALEYTQPFLDNIDEMSKHYDVVIASPAINSGVSIEHTGSPHFDYVAAFFCGLSVTPLDAYQMLGRVRYVKDFHITIAQRRNAVINADDVIHGIQHSSPIAHTDYDKVAAYNQERIDESKNSFANGILYILQQKMFTVGYDDVVANDCNKAELKQLRKDLKEDYIRKLITAYKISCDDELLALCDGGPISQYDQYAIDAYKMRKHLHLKTNADLTDDHFDIEMSLLYRHFYRTTDTQYIFHERQQALINAVRHADKHRLTQYLFEKLNINEGVFFDSEMALTWLHDVVEPRCIELAVLGVIPKKFGTTYWKPTLKNAQRDVLAILDFYGIKAARCERLKIKQNPHFGLFLYIHIISVGGESDEKMNSEKTRLRGYEVDLSNIPELDKLTNIHITTYLQEKQQQQEINRIKMAIKPTYESSKKIVVLQTCTHS